MERVIRIKYHYLHHNSSFNANKDQIVILVCTRFKNKLLHFNPPPLKWAHHANKFILHKNKTNYGGCHLIENQQFTSSYMHVCT